jgi:hypothetical protein
MDGLRGWLVISGQPASAARVLVHEAKLLEFQEIASRRRRQDGEALAFGLALEWGSGTSKGSWSGTSGLVARLRPGRPAAPDETTPDRGRLCHPRATRRVTGGSGSSARWAWRRAIAQRAGRIRSENSLGAVSLDAAFELEDVFLLLPVRARNADVDNLARPVVNMLFDSRDEQADRTLTATLFDAEDAQIHRLILGKRVVADPAEEGIDVTVRWDARENAD